MRQRQLSDGRVRLQVSQLCLGTMYFGYRTDEPTSFAILDRFLEAGGNFLDTANNYGQWHGEAGESERVIGRWRRSRGITDEVVIATKVGARTLRPGDPGPEHWQGLGARTIRADAETSLRQLGTERLDLYYAHIDDRATPQEETVDALATLAEQGYDHPTNRARLAVLREVAAELGAIPAQMVLAWLMQGRPPMIPVVGASTVAQLEELLGAVDLRLDGDVLERLDAAGRQVDDWTAPAPAATG